MVKHIIILTTVYLPESNASSARMIAYARALQSQGIDVEIVIFKPNVKEDCIPIAGEYSGIRYHYTHQRSNSQGKMHKILLDRPIALINALRDILLKKKSRCVDCVFLTSFESINYLLLFSSFCSILHINTILTADEYPTCIRNEKRSSLSSCEAFLLKWVLKRVTACILINKSLQLFYLNLVPNLKVFLLPAIIDVSRFTKADEKYDGRNYLCYMGGFDLNNDNVDLIVKAFAAISVKYKDVDLFLYGSPNSSDLMIVNSIISENQLSDRVFLKGHVDYFQVPSILQNAYILVTSQSNTIRAKGGFPTKTCEYLMSGVPAIMSDVSIISHYIKNKEHAFLVPPDNLEAYIKTLEYVMDNYAKARLVADNGKRYVQDHFSSQHQGLALSDFMNSVCVL